MTDRESNLVRLPRIEEIEEEAADWFARIRSGGLSAEEVSEFEAWRNTSDRHRQVFNDLEVVWDEFSALDELEDLGRSALGVGREEARKHNRRVFFGMAATLAAVMVGGGVLYNRSINSYKTYHETAATAVGEQKTIVLADGSRVQLNTDSALVVEYSAKARNIRLTKGEAYFAVAKDKSRPFIVSTDNGVVTAVGTEFTVRVRPSDVIEVIVAEGRVALTPQTSPENINKLESDLIRAVPVAELTRGQVAIFQNNVEDIDLVPEVELNRKMSWRQGMLAYSGETLEEVVEDVSRYTEVNIEISDPDIKDMMVHGYFKVGETEVFFEILELTFGIEVERVNEGSVRLSWPA